MYIVSKIKKNWLVLMYNGGFTSLKHKNYVEGKNNKYGCHGNQVFGHCIVCHSIYRF
jgi:hypothetical protein